MTVDRRRIPQQRRSSNRVDAILAAARSLLQDHDPADISTRTVAARAGVSPATIYRYFSDKDEMVDALLSEHSQIAEATIVEALEACAERSVASVFELVVRTYLDLYTRRPELTVAWRSPALADRQRSIEESSDQSLAVTVGRHLVERRLWTELTPQSTRLLAAHWATAGALIGVILRTEPSSRQPLIDELIAMVHFFAGRYFSGEVPGISRHP